MATGRTGAHGDSASERAGRVLESLRHLHRMTLTELARRAECSRTTLDAKRAGTSSWTLADVETFAAVFDVAPAVFLFADDTFWLWWSSNGRHSTPSLTPHLAAAAGGASQRRGA